MDDKVQNSRQYDLEERTFQCAKNCRSFVKKLPKTSLNLEDGVQLTKASGSVAANYIEANESLSRKDCLLRIKISRKEAKESRLWLKLVDTNNNPFLDSERNKLIQESIELTKIFGSMIEKFK